MTTTCAATSATPEPDPVSETLATIDALIARAVTLAEDIAALRARLADLGEERRVREAYLSLSTEGKNEAERTARLRVALAGDAEYQRCAQTERDARRELSRLEAQHWAVRQRLHATIVLLRLAAQDPGDAGETGIDQDWKTAQSAEEVTPGPAPASPSTWAPPPSASRSIASSRSWPKPCAASVTPTTGARPAAPRSSPSWTRSWCGPAPCAPASA